MRAGFELLLALVLAVAGVAAEEPRSKCDTKDFACHDVMNSSQCLAQLIYDKNAKTTREALIKCVDTEGSASSLPGATRLCRCSGCHTAQINAVIEALFPPPCGAA